MSWHPYNSKRVSRIAVQTHTHTNPSEDKDPPRVLFSISSSALFVIRHSRSSVRESTTDKSLFLSQQLYVVVVPEIMYIETREGKRVRGMIPSKNGAHLWLCKLFHS